MLTPFNSLARPALLCSFLLMIGCGSSGGNTPEVPPPANSSSSSSTSSSSSSSSPIGAPNITLPPPPAPVTLCGYLEEGSGIAIETSTTRVEAENFDGCGESFTPVADLEAGNGYRGEPVDIREVPDSSNGHVLHHSDQESYFDYSVQVARSGMYRIIYYSQPSETGINYSLSHGERALTNSGVSVSSIGDSVLHATDVYLSDGPQILRLNISGGRGALDYLEFIYEEDLVLDAHATVAAMGIGINLGNTLDAPAEGEWALPAQEHFLEDFRSAGFLNVRIPVTWENHMAESTPYAVDDERMARAEQVVDWALAQGFYVTLNAHHESWLKENYNGDTQARFDGLWAQIAHRFQNKSARLIFEILNEPVGMTAEQVNPLNHHMLGIIRDTNPKRLVVIAGEDYSGVHTLSTLDVPDDDYLIGNFHSYDPWEFAGACERTTWGTANDKAELDNLYQAARDWSVERGVPVMINEFGAAKYDYAKPENKCELASRLEYLRHHVNLATQHGIAATFWDDGGSFSSYNRENRTWGDEKDVLVAPNP